MVPPEVSTKRGSVVLVRFPFSDLSETKVRPVVVLANGERGDSVLCQVTGNPYGDTGAIVIEAADFSSGSLRRVSYARPSKLFTANQSLIVGEVGLLKAELFNRIVESVVALLRGS